MPYKEKEIIKKYFSIGEVANKLNVNTSQIRFWEKEFEILNPKKNKSGSRKYTAKDIKIIEKIYRLLKDDKFTIDGARKEITKRNYKTESDIIIHLKKIKKKLISLKEKL
tara:strand:+ start:569 stop:898 length:330 start_codon:yes stop_codon:yes gene_type:complete